MVDSDDTKKRDPFKWLEQKAAEAVAKAEQKKAQAAAQTLPSARVIQLPLWPENVRGIPNAALRSALFGVAKKGTRAYLQRQKIASVEGLTIFYHGPRLTQHHLDVWEQCLHIARVAGTGKIVRFTAYSFLKAIGRSTGKSDREWLKIVLLDLASSVVEISDGRRDYFGPLIHHGVQDEATKEYVIEINPKLARLYGADGWTQIEFEQRQALRKQPLAQWLHAFYSTHAQPYAYKVETIRRLCGSENKELFSFRQKLREALSKLASVTGWTWQIDEQDLVHVHTRPTPSQARHLIRKKLKTTSKKRPKG